MKYPIILYFIYSFVQTPDPVKWNFFSKKVDADSSDIHMRASIAKGWHLYSQINEGGPGPSSVHLEKNKIFKPIGDIKELGKRERKYEKLFKAYVMEFSSSVDFVQRMERKDTGNAIITGVVKYIACNGTLCLPPKELPFSITINRDSHD